MRITTGRWLRLALLCALLSLWAIQASAQPTGGANFQTETAPVINEFSASHTGTDNREYVEIFGAPNTDYSAYTFLAIEGDFSGAVTGIVDRVIPIGTTDANGYWWTGFLAQDSLENGTNSFLLVQNFSGAQGNDLDTNDDGTLDVTPWTAIVDSVAVHDGGASDKMYANVTLGVSYDGLSFAPGGASRIPNGTDTNTTGDWVRNDFDLAGIPGFTGTLVAGEALNTPNAVNSTTPADSAPTVSSTQPANNATDVPVNANISITFSEAVTVTDPWFTITCATSGAHTAAVSGGATTFTLNPDADFANNESCTVTVTGANVADQDGAPTPMTADYSFSFTTVAGDVCAEPFTAIPTLQENGANFGAAGAFTVQGVVTGDFQTNDIGGFYIQDPTGDGNPATSDGIFVYDPAPLLLDVAAGDIVRVTGTVTEFIRAGATAGLTELNATSVTHCGTGGTILPVVVTLPAANATAFEQYESMLVTFEQTLTVSEVYQVGRWGEVILAPSRLYIPTQIVEPGAAAVAQQGQNDLARLVLDDARITTQNPDPTPYLFNEPTLRVGYTVANVTGILSFETNPNDTSIYKSAYRLFPTVAPVFSATNNPRPTPPVVAGTLQAASFNVLNYFNGDGMGGGFPTSRGAESLVEFNRQRDKIIQAIFQMNADVVGLMEIENDGGATPAVADLVNGLNAVAGAGTYAFIDTGVIGSDVIRVAIIYQPGQVTPTGAAMIDFAAIHSRPPVAQTFVENATGAVFTAVVNHFKSKGCGDATGLDTDQGDGQSCYNATRVAQAEALVNFINGTVIPTSGDADVLLLGDFNSYAMEDPIDVLKAAGYVDLAAAFNANNYSYVFMGQTGTLDYALASSSLAAQAVDAHEWHINTDEPVILDYNLNFKSVAQQALNVGTPYRSSDHDPVIAGFNLVAPPAAPTPIAPVGDVNETNPYFTFTPTAGATWYHIWLSGHDGFVFDQWFDAADICSVDLCTVNYELSLTHGWYQWWIQAWNAAGGYGEWSNAINFNVNVLPGIPTPIAPVGTIYTGTPTFEWSADPTVAWYHLWVSGSDGYVTDQWYEAYVVCGVENCSVMPPLDLPLGYYTWWARGWNAAGYGEWSSGTQFAVSLPLSTPVPVAPTGTIYDTTPDFQWNAVAGAEWYIIWLSDRTTNTQVTEMGFNHYLVCAGGVCTGNTGVTLTEGHTYGWWIIAWSSISGYSAWSGETSFTVNGAPSLIETQPVEVLTPETTREVTLPEAPAPEAVTPEAEN